MNTAATLIAGALLGLTLATTFPIHTCCIIIAIAALACLPLALPRPTR